MAAVVIFKCASAAVKAFPSLPRRLKTIMKMTCERTWRKSLAKFRNWRIVDFGEVNSVRRAE
ncbi:MAG: hypothetical protein ACTS47_02530 [Candidatus Hodgkinia cicadicola]